MKKLLVPEVEKSIRILAALGIIGGVTFFYWKIFSVNNVTVALSYLLAVLAIATQWGSTEGLEEKRFQKAFISALAAR